MKYAVPQLVTMLLNNKQIPFQDCYTFTLQTGDPVSALSILALGNRAGREFFFTTSDIPCQIGVIYFVANSVRVEGLRYKIETGLQVDEQEITCHATASDLIGTQPFAAEVPFLKACRLGLLDGAYIKRERAFFEPSTYPPTLGYPAQAVDAITLFSGRVSQIISVGRTEAKLQVKSDTVLLDIDMPRNLFSPGCTHILFDTGCNILASQWAAYGQCAALSTPSKIVWASATDGYFDQGTLSVTSGVNQGATRTIKESDGANLYLTYPLDTTPGVGDTFTAWPGCDHTLATCKSKFNNTSRFRGFPFIPDFGHGDLMRTENALERHAVVAEAERWLGTPYHDQAQVIGVGCDCAGLPLMVYANAGVIPHAKLPFYPPDWALHRDEERYLKHVEMYAHEISGPPKTGDFVIYKFGRCFSHGGIVVNWPLIIHATKDEGVSRHDGTSARLRDTKGAMRPHKFFTIWGTP